MGAVAAPAGRGFARLPAVTAALVGATACAILVVSPSTPPLKHPAYGAAARSDPHRVTFRGLGTTYVAASGRSGGGFLAFTDVMNTGDHRVTITGVEWTLQHAARLEDIALKRIGRGGATFGPRLIRPRRRSTCRWLRERRSRSTTGSRHPGAGRHAPLDAGKGAADADPVPVSAGCSRPQSGAYVPSSCR